MDLAFGKSVTYKTKNYQKLLSGHHTTVSTYRIVLLVKSSKRHLNVHILSAVYIGVLHFNIFMNLVISDLTC